MNELYAVMLSWAVTLSGYSTPPSAPEVLKVSHDYLVENACGGRECKVVGWFPPGQTVYLDQRLNPQDSLLHASIVVHEMVHYLQHQSGKFDKHSSCEQAIALEREAYGVQREFLLRYGVYQPVGASMHAVGCELAAQETLSRESAALEAFVP
jgi:hypothetical protein